MKNNPTSIKFQELQFDTYKVPELLINKGELIGIYIGNDSNATKIEHELVKHFQTYKNSSGISVFQPIVDLLFDKKSRFRKIYETLFPLTVRSFIKRNAHPKSNLADRIYEIEYIQPSSRVFGDIPSTPRKLLSIYCGLSKHKNIVFTTGPIDHLGEKEVVEFIKQHISKTNGTAIWLDYFGALKELCHQYIEVLEDGKPMQSYRPDVAFRLP